MPLPKLTLEEKKQALKKAQQVRSERAKIRQDLKAGRTGIREILEQVDNDVIAKMRVAYLLESLPRIGKVRTRKIMNEIGIDETRRIQGLGSRQKQALLERFGNQ
ncbi:MAG TPA: integration host factor [Firmicutes bacterium]|uniref:Integration host factor n=1 Tax=Capillibacterium thermochitinicola TaxID=2699427 RepID=A0A8J6I2M4_9FIRM|nr:integration host factor, actinobacterial type [Capillibacterium thermochitinicola]MBA2133554.1 integration host factor [Capillibacterium thermochitinicola]NLC54071.1 integration host factor [Bacillota bacterium]HHW12342.1 integration host factor [Bacillota bacterium]